ncbi:MAG: copper chaperone PCu(A)C [Pseudomonadota bacterium]
MINHPWSRPSIAKRPAAAYLTVSNAGAQPDRLVGASAPDFSAVELHLSAKENGVMTMQSVEVIEVPAGGTAELVPGGYHLMLFGGEKTFGIGDSFPLRLEFENAGFVDVEVKVDKPPVGATPPNHGGHEGHGTN